MNCKLALVISFLIVSQQSLAKSTDNISWIDWKSSTPSKVQGTLQTTSGTVKATFKGTYSFAQIDGGDNYWLPTSTYISLDVKNAPNNSDIIGLDEGGTVTITFSNTVQDPLFAFVSWNDNTVDFGVPIEILSYGESTYWGSGTPVLNGTGTGFYGDGEASGVIRLKGSYKSITFTHTSESWHGFTIGVAKPAKTSLTGMVKGLTSYTISCANDTTGQTISLPLSSMVSFDCGKAGLKMSPSQNVTITIKGGLQ